MVNSFNNNELDSINSDYFEKLPNDIAIITKVWGPPIWFFLHSSALAYPKKINNNNPEHIAKKKSMFSFLSNLGNILPCPVCSVSYNNYIKQPELSIWEHLDYRADIVHFIYKIHEKVNDKLGVPKCERPTFKEVINFYNKYIAGPCKATTEKERQNRLLEGCNNEEIDKGKFKKYKCSVNVLNENNKKLETMIPKKENFSEIKSDINGINNILLLTTLIFLIIIIVLLYLLYKK